MGVYDSKTHPLLYFTNRIGVDSFNKFNAQTESLFGFDVWLSTMHDTGLWNTVISDTAPTDLSAIWIDPNNPATAAASIVKMHDGTNWVTATPALFAQAHGQAISGAVVPPTESITSSDGEVMINPSAGNITIGADASQAGMTAQGFLTIHQYITAAVTAGTSGNVKSVEGVLPDASGDIQIPTRTPDPASQENVFVDASGIGKFAEPDNIYEFNVCAENGSSAPSGLPTTEKIYWATGNGLKIMMAKAADGLFYPVNYINIDTVQWFNGLIYNGSAHDLCNVNFQTQSLVRMTDEAAPNGARAYWRGNDGNPKQFYQQVIVGDYITPLNTSFAHTLSFDVRWTDAANAGNQPEAFYAFLVPHDRDNEIMTYPMYYPSPFGTDYDDWAQTGNVTPQTHSTCGPNIFLTQALNPGDTVVHLNDISWWATNATSWNTRALRFLNYKDSNGNPYFIYTREVPLFSVGANLATDGGHFANSGINTGANTITLNNAWHRGVIPAGTRVCNTRLGSTYFNPVAESKATHLAAASEGEWRTVTATIQNASDPSGAIPTEATGIKVGVGSNFESAQTNTASFYWDYANFFLDRV